VRIIVARRTAAILLLTVLAPFSAGIEIVGDDTISISGGAGAEYRVILQYDASSEEIDRIITRLGDGLELMIVNGHDWETRKVPSGALGVDRPPENVLRPTVIHLPPLDHSENIMEWIRGLPIVHHVEEVLTTKGRNAESAALVSGDSIQEYAAAWAFGMNGEGVILASADSGIDRGHDCFRNLNASGTAETSVGVPSLSHRKIVVHNTSIDEEDRNGDADFGHGTHTAGILACWDVEEYEAGSQEDRNGSMPGEGTAASHAARLVIQDIVDGDWTPPELDRLLAEGGVNGAIIHSESWGDDTLTYTERAAVLDRWSRENPWSVVLFAPGNNGGTALEPANARNVLSIGASSGSSGVYYQSNKGPALEGGEGVHLLAPGYSILSAKADGSSQTLNGEFMAKTGTSMSTPMAASTLGQIEQMVREGWIMGDETAAHLVPVEDIRPAWWPPDAQSQGMIIVGHGFEPSGPLLRSLAGAATTSIAGATHQSGPVGAPLDGVQGWGRLNLSRLIDWGGIEDIEKDGEEMPAPGVWIYDSYRAKREDAPAVAERLALRLQSGVGDRPLDRLMTSRLTSSGLTGPFLASGEGMDWELVPHAKTVQRNGGLTIQLAWADRPLEQGHDDLQVCISIDTGIHTCGNDLEDGKSRTYTTLEEARAVNSPEFSMEGIRLSPEIVLNADSIILRLFANTVIEGNFPDTLGIDGGRVGFGMTVIGARPNTIGENGTSNDGSIPFSMQTSTPLTVGVDPIMLQISQAMRNASIIANEGRGGVDMRIDDLFNLERLAQLDIHSLRVEPSHPWDGLETPIVKIHACDGSIPPQCSEGRERHTEFNSSDIFRFDWDPEFSGVIDVPLSVMTTDGGAYNLNLTIFLMKVIDGDLAWFNATGVIETHWLGGANEPTITQSDSTISVRFLDDSRGLLDVVMDNEMGWTWEATFTNLEGGWQDGVVCSNGSSQAIASATIVGESPEERELGDCEGRLIEISTAWKRGEEIEGELSQPWIRLGAFIRDVPKSLVNATWSVPLEFHPWSEQEEWKLETCSILIGSDTIGCEEWIPVDAAQSVMVITEWEKDGYIIQDRWTIRGPELNTLDLVGEWASLVELNGTFNLLRDNETTHDWPILLRYEPLDMISDELDEVVVKVPESWPVRLEDEACKRLRISIAQRNEVTVSWTSTPNEKESFRVQVFELGDVTAWTIEEGVVKGASPQGIISIPMTVLGESVKGGCDGGGIVNTQRAGEKGGGVPSWMIVVWGAITAIFVGMILHSRQQRSSDQENGRGKNPFPENSEDSQDKNPHQIENVNDPAVLRK